ncbi:MAG: hypothetical protein RL519_126 [Pseudomonadota bacterium]
MFAPCLEFEVSLPISLLASSCQDAVRQAAKRDPIAAGMQREQAVLEISELRFTKTQAGLINLGGERDMRKWIRLYVAGFLALTGTDLASTLWAASKGNGQEFNATVSDGAGLLAVERLLAVNGGLLLFSVGMLWWALQRRDRIDPAYLAHPAHAVFNYFYLNPFADKRIPVSAFHYIAFAPAILMFKTVVSLNNSLIAAGIPDLITPLAVFVDKIFANDMATYWTIIIVLFHHPLVGISPSCRSWIASGKGAVSLDQIKAKRFRQFGSD